MIGIVGAGAFGGALAMALGREGPVTLWGRRLQRDMRKLPRLGDEVLPDPVTLTGDLADLAGIETVLLALPMQILGGFLADHGAALGARRLVACCKGVDLATGLGPTGVIAAALPYAVTAILTGPSFAADLAQGLPTALTLACADPAEGEALQRALSTPLLRLYRTTDVAGAELGGALKNVIAIAAGVVMGAGLGASARAALMTRGFAEMQRFATARGAEAETLMGLSGLGDLVLTCTSDRSRNFRYGVALGAGKPADGGATVEGVATAQAVAQRAMAEAVDMPVTAMVAALTRGEITPEVAVSALMSRPLREE